MEARGLVRRVDRQGLGLTQHTALLPLAGFLNRLGLNVVELDGWDEAQGSYFWTDPDSGVQRFDMEPSGYMVHHSAGSHATPTVRDARGRWSVANAWIGLQRNPGDGTLHHEGPGEPLIVLVSAGPARTSSGFGFRPAAWDHTFQDRRAPAHAEGPDGDTALNRYVVNVETVHPGRGAAIDERVWAHVVGFGIGLHEMFGWNERTLGHTSWTGRKPDPEWSLGLPNDGRDAIVDVQNAIADIGPIPIPPPTNGVDVYLPLIEGDGFDVNPDRREDVRWLQMALRRAGLFDSPIDGRYGPLTSAGVRALGARPESDGTMYASEDHDALLRDAYGNGDAAGFVPHIHATDEGRAVE